MRMAFTAALAFAAFAAAATAFASPVSIRPVATSAEFQDKLQEEYGERELRELSDAINDALARELERVGAAVEPQGPLAIEIVIEDAKPNRPTFKQLGDRPGLSLTSFGLGGAELTARIVDTRTNETVQTVTYAWYERDIEDAIVTTTWTDARRAIRRFAKNVAEALSETQSTPEPGAPES